MFLVRLIYVSGFIVVFGAPVAGLYYMARTLGL